jgi:cell division protein FtsW
MKRGHRPDYFLIVVVFLLTVAGLIILSSASSDLGKLKFNDSYYYLKHQVAYGLLVGIGGFLFVLYFPYRHYRKIALPLLIASVITLVLVFTPLGLEVRNTNRWLALGPLSFQPAEPLKLVYLLYVAAWLSNAKAKRETSLFEGFIPFLLVSGLIAILLLMQPATSTVVILLGSGMMVYFLSGARLKYLLGMAAIGMVGIGLVIYFTPYRLQRLLTYVNSQTDAQGSGYHINQALIAIGSGGLWGVGYGQSAAKVNYLPAPIDDSIFAVAAEEFGFAGASIIVMLFALLTFRLLWLARSTRDRFGKLLLFGFAAVIALQSLVNMAAISGLLPLTGVPLPFVSYGGTALAVFLTMMGIATNVSKYS